jgi:Protein of unknown function (DUF2637)
MVTDNIPRSRGLFKITDPEDPEVWHVTDRLSIRKLDRTRRGPGSGLIGAATILLALLGAGLFFVSFRGQFVYLFSARHEDTAAAIEAAMLDTGMIVFTMLALGLSRAGKSSRTERALILACALASAAMNYLAADTASPRSVVAYTAAPVFLAVVVDRVVAVVRRHVLGVDEVSAWTAAGTAAGACVRLAGAVTLYSLRFVLAPAETAGGLRRMVLTAAPVPETARRDHPATAPEVLPETAPEAVPGTAPEVAPRPVLEAVPAIPARSQERPPVALGKQPGPATPERLAEFYAADLAAGRVPSKRQIKRDWPVGFDAASELHEQLAVRAAP